MSVMIKKKILKIDTWDKTTIDELNQQFLKYIVICYLVDR